MFLGVCRHSFLVFAFFIFLVVFRILFRVILVGVVILDGGGGGSGSWSGGGCGGGLLLGHIAHHHGLRLLLLVARSSWLGGCGRGSRLGIRIGSILGGLFGSSISFSGSGCGFSSSLALFGICVHLSFGGRLVCGGLGGLFGGLSCSCLLSLLCFGFRLILCLLSFLLGFLSSLLALLHRFFFLSFDGFLGIVCDFLSISTGGCGSFSSIISG